MMTLLPYCDFYECSCALMCVFLAPILHALYVGRNQNRIYFIIRFTNVPCTEYCLPVAGNKKVYLGGAKSNGEWKWPYGAPFSYTAWASGQPGDKICMTLKKSKWYGVDCGKEFLYICQLSTLSTDSTQHYGVSIGN